MPKITENVEITLLCSDFRFLRDKAKEKGITLDEYISNIIESKLNYQEPVRCKNCKYYHGVNFGCEALNLYPKPNWFCADGVRRNER